MADKGQAREIRAHAAASAPLHYSVEGIELVAYDQPYNEPLYGGGKRRVNFLLRLFVSVGDERLSATVEGLAGPRPGKPMAGRYWRNLESVAYALERCEIPDEYLRQGRMGSKLKERILPENALGDAQGIGGIGRWMRMQQAIIGLNRLLDKLMQELARSRDIQASPGAKAKTKEPDIEALFSRSVRVLFLPEREAPGYSYQPTLKGVLQKASPDLPPNASDDVEAMLPLGTMDAKSHLMERECIRQGFNIMRTGKGVFTATRDGQSFHFKLSRSPLVTVDAIALCTHKEATREFLAPLGFPVPVGRMFPCGDYENATRYANLIGYPVVVKPATGVRGIGVVPNILNDDELQRAFHVLETSKLGHDDFIVEKHIFGEDYRIMVIDGKVRAATLRAPASITGDGRHTIAELILTKNRYRQNIPHLKSRPIVYTESARYQLDKMGYTLRSVPPAGEMVKLSGSCNLSQGGDSVNVQHEMHPSIIKVAEDAVRAVPGLDYCGIDFLIEDHRKPIGETDIGICELNAHAAIGTACYPMYGDPVNVPRQAIEAIVEKHGMPLAPVDDTKLSVKIKVKGRVTQVGFRDWVEKHAVRSGLKGYVRYLDKRSIEMLLQGPLVAIASITTASIRGPAGAIPTSVRVQHVNDEPLRDDFRKMK
jgi:D-alanine-D-alanine ligase-like ATP-grasp enzyme/acylphosphatase